MVENKSNGSNGNNAYININSRKKYENNTEIINNNCDNNNIDDNYSYTEGGWRKRYERGRGKKKKIQVEWTCRMPEATTSHQQSRPSPPPPGGTLLHLNVCNLLTCNGFFGICSNWCTWCMKNRVGVLLSWKGQEVQGKQGVTSPAWSRQQILNWT